MSESGIKKSMQKALYESKDFGLQRYMENEYKFPSGLESEREKIRKCDWGVPDKEGNKLSGETTYDFEQYRTVSPETFHSIGFGTCWDFVEAQREAYERWGYKVNTFYIELDNKEKASHTILTWREGGVTWWDESAFKKIEGLHCASSTSYIFDWVGEKIGDKVSGDWAWKVWRYEKPPFKLSVEEYMRWIYDEGSREF